MKKILAILVVPLLMVTFMGDTQAGSPPGYSGSGGGSTAVEDDVYGVGWNGDTTNAASQNALYDKISTMAAGLSAVGPGCAAGACMTDGVVTSGTDIFIWEGTTDNAAEMSFVVPADPGADIVITFPTSTATLSGLGLTETFAGAKTFSATTAFDEEIDIDLDNADEEVVITNTAEYGANGAQLTIDNSDADVGAQMYLLNLDYSADDNQANADYIIAQDSGGEVFRLSENGDMVSTGDLTLSGDDLNMGADPGDTGAINLSNAGVISWEDATETTITHVDNTGLLINLELEVDGTLDADGVVALGDGGDNFSVASDGIDIDTSGNITNGGTIGSGAITSTGAVGGTDLTASDDIIGQDDLQLDSDAALIQLGEDQDVVITHVADAGILMELDDYISFGDSAVFIESDDDGYLDLDADTGIRLNGAATVSGVLTATAAGANITVANGQLIDFNAVTYVNAATTNEGIAIPPYIAGAAPASGHNFIAWDATNDYMMVFEAGGWVNASQGSGASTALNFITTQAEGDLSTESVLTAGTGIDVTDAGGDGGAITVAVDATDLDALTWSDNANASNIWTFNVSGTDHTMTAGNGLMTFGDAVTVTDTLTATNGIALGTSKSITGTTAITIGDDAQTIAIDSSDWNIGATGNVDGIGTLSMGDALTLSDGATIDQSANNYVTITENSDTLAAYFDADNVDVIWSDGVLNLRNSTDSDNAIVEIEGKDAGERGELRVLSDGDDKNIAIYHDDTDGMVTSSSGNLMLSADGDTDDFIEIDTTTNVPSIAPDSNDGGTLGTASVGWSDLYLANGAVLTFTDATATTLTHVDNVGLSLNLDFRIADNYGLVLGTGQDWDISYDETTDDALEFITAATAAAATTDPMFLIQVGTTPTANQDIFGVYKGTTKLFDVDEDGDVYAAGTITSKASEDPGVVLDETTASDTDYWFGLNADQEGDDDDYFEIGTGTTIGTSTVWQLDGSGNVIGEGNVQAEALVLDGGTYSSTIDPGTPTESVTYQWPLADGTSGQVMATNASGVMSWTTVTATPAGSNYYIQWNNSTAMDGEAAFTYNDDNNTMSITQSASNPSIQTGDGTYSWNFTPQVGIEGILEVDSDIAVEDDIYMDSDSAVIHLGEDADIKITHVADTGITVLEGTEEILVLKDGGSGSAVNEVTILSAATTAHPTIQATGEANTGLDFENSESEEGLTIDFVATGTNNLQIANAANAASPSITAVGSSDANVGIGIDAKAAGEIIIGSADAKFSLVSDALNITNAGALSGVTTIGMTGAVTGTTAMTMGSATVDTGVFTMIKGAQTSDPQTTLTMSADGVGALTLATANGSDGDITLTPSGGQTILTTDLTVSGGDVVLGTTSIFSGGDTASLNNIDAIDATTETTLEAAIDALSSLVTVGTVASGTWAATDVGVAYGGTGVSTLADGGLVIGNAAGAVEVVAAGTATQILVGGGASTAPVWGTDLPTAVTIGSGYVYRGGGTDVADIDVVDDITVTSTKALSATSGTFTGELTGVLDINVSAAAVANMAAADCSGSLYYNTTQANNYELPAAAAGLNCCFYSSTAHQVDVEPEADQADNIIYEGLAMAADEALQSPGAAGDFICIAAIDANTWVVLGHSGTWVEETPP